MSEKDEFREELFNHYNQIEDHLRAITQMQGRDGLLTDWIIVSAVQSFDKDGTPVTNTGWHTNPQSALPYHRMLGLIEYAGSMLRAEVTEDG